MMKIAFLGLGAMGIRMVSHLVTPEYQVSVWNRHPKNNDVFDNKGILFCHSIADAVAGADLVISMLRDDEASRAVWLDPNRGALRHCLSGTKVIECSTLSAQYIDEWASACRANDLLPIEAPLAGSRPQAEQQQLVFFVGGERQVIESVQSVLLKMGKVVNYCGAIGNGARIKLMINALLASQVGFFAEWLKLMQKNELPPEIILKCLETTPLLSPAAALAAKSIVTKNFAAMFPIHLVAKDLSYALVLAKHSATQIPITEQLSRIFQQAVDLGYADDNITGVGQIFDHLDAST